MSRDSGGFKSIIAAATALLLLSFSTAAVRADFSDGTGGSGGGEACETNPGSDGGGDPGDSDSWGDEYSGDPCLPGTIITLYTYQPHSSGLCVLIEWRFDCDTGMHGASTVHGLVPCPDGGGGGSEHPCDEFEGTPGSIACRSWRWGFELAARVAFPGVCLDVRPFPVSLVRWPSGVRFSCAPDASASDYVEFVNKGGGSPGNPRPGDWSEVTFTLSLRPATRVMYVDLPHADIPPLPLVSEISPPFFFRWELPSHPFAGGGARAGSISGLGELPADMPLFVGDARTPYHLYWELRYLEWVEIWGEECSAYPDANGDYPCWRILIDRRWQPHSRGGQIHPSAVPNLSPSIAADLDGDGLPDAYWNRNVTLRRMNDHNRVNDPLWRRRRNWGGRIYWGVREGQAQIGWVDE